MISFSLYFLTFMFIESDINNHAAKLLGAQLVNHVYAGGLFCTAGGYFLYGILSKKFVGHNIVKSSVICALLTNILSLFLSHTLLYILDSYMCLIFLGIVGGYLHEQVGIINQSKRLGIYLGLCMAIAIIVQFVLQSISDSHLISIGLLLLLTIFIILPIATNNKLFEPTNIEQQSSGVFWDSVIVTLMSCILALQDSIVVLKNANGEIELFSYVRLFYAIGLLLAGLLTTYNNGRFFNLSVICSAFISTIAIATFQSGNTYYNISMMVMYFYSGFYVMFLTYTYIIKGRGQSNSGLISGLGRVIRSTVTAIVVIVMIPFSGHESLTIISAVSCLFAIAILVLAYFGNLLTPVSNVQEVKIAVFEEEHFVNFFNKYELTDREQEVFRLYITTEQENQSIADILGISRRVLQRHIATIYEKTETHTRVGLLQKFLEK